MSGTPELKASISARAFDMRLAGMSYARIARELSLPTPEAAYRATEQHLRNTSSWETRVDAGVLEVERLNRLTELLWQRAEDTGDLATIEQLTKLISKRANMLGLNFRDLVAAKKLELEADKVRLLARALSSVLTRNGISGPVYDAITADLFQELRQLGGRSDDWQALDATDEAYITLPLDDEELI